MEANGAVCVRVDANDRRVLMFVPTVTPCSCRHAARFGAGPPGNGYVYRTTAADRTAPPAYRRLPCSVSRSVKLRC